MLENQTTEKKSLRLVEPKPDWFELAKQCIAFANAAGGKLAIGIENDDEFPPKGQKIADNLLELIPRKVNQNTLNVRAAAKKVTAANGAEYLELTVSRNSQGFASTTDGRYFLRVGDD